MAWFTDWLLSFFIASRTIRILRGEIQRLELSLELAKMEAANSKRMHEAAMDTIQAFGLHNRAIGMEAKVYAAEIVASTTKPRSQQDE